MLVSKYVLTPRDTLHTAPPMSSVSENIAKEYLFRMRDLVTKRNVKSAEDL